MKRFIATVDYATVWCISAGMPQRTHMTRKSFDDCSFFTKCIVILSHSETTRKDNKHPKLIIKPATVNFLTFKYVVILRFYGGAPVCVSVEEVYSKNWTVPKLKETIKAILEEVVEENLGETLNSVFNNMTTEFGLVSEDNSNEIEIIETIIQFH